LQLQSVVFRFDHQRADYAGVARQNSDLSHNQVVEKSCRVPGLTRKWSMLRLLMLLATMANGLLRSRGDLLLENLALRQQLAALTRGHSRPRLAGSDRIFWVLLRRFWSGWQGALVFVQPETVIRWHRNGFKLYWKWISRKHAVVGRKPTSREMRELIFRIVAENRTWGAPRIHGELKMLGFDISERTVLRWMRKAPRAGEAMGGVLEKTS
jgi:hypothetical protein